MSTSRPSWKRRLVAAYLTLLVLLTLVVCNQAVGWFSNPAGDFRAGSARGSDGEGDAWLVLVTPVRDALAGMRGGRPIEDAPLLLGYGCFLALPLGAWLLNLGGLRQAGRSSRFAAALLVVAAVLLLPVGLFLVLALLALAITGGVGPTMAR